MLNPQTNQTFEEILHDIGNMVYIENPPVTGIFTAKRPHKKVLFSVIQGLYRSKISWTWVMADLARRLSQQVISFSLPNLTTPHWSSVWFPVRPMCCSESDLWDGKWFSGIICRIDIMNQVKRRNSKHVDIFQGFSKFCRYSASRSCLKIIRTTTCFLRWGGSWYPPIKLDKPHRRVHSLTLLSTSNLSKNTNPAKKSPRWKVTTS